MMKIRRFALATLALSILPAAAWSQSCDCDVSAGRRTASDALLVLDNQERDESESIHLPWGVPTGSERLLHQRHYVTRYDDDLRVPLWVAYRLRDSDIAFRRERTECFRRDHRLSDGTDTAFCEDYEEPIFDRGGTWFRTLT